MAEVTRFWLSANGNSRGIHWKNKDLFCSPNFFNGLGFKELATMNSALLTKQVYRLMQNPNSYWGSISSRAFIFHSLCFGMPGSLREAHGFGRVLCMEGASWNPLVGEALGQAMGLTLLKIFGLLMVIRLFSRKVLLWLKLMSLLIMPPSLGILMLYVTT